MAMRKHYTAAFKAQEEKTIAQISTQYGVHVTMLHRWKNTAIEKLSTVFEDEDKKSMSVLKTQHEQEMAELYSKIGKLTTQLD
ncbi:MAG: transposase [Bacilli bacterium]